MVLKNIRLSIRTVIPFQVKSSVVSAANHLKGELIQAANIDIVTLGVAQLI
jgi:hypothetical protein